MFKTLSYSIFFISFCATQAFSASTPPPPSATTAVIRTDPRIRHYAYSENNVYRLDLYLKSVTAVQFESGEEVESILIGDSASWEVVKLKSGNVVSIKPVVAAADTNMTIYTDRRVYSFELHSSGESVPGAPNIFRSVFTYPAPPKRRTTPVTTAPVIIRTDYLVAGQASFRPKWVQDNGRQTTFFLATNAPRPAIFKVGADQKEELINSRTDGSRIIVDGISDIWVLRIGDQSICIKVDKQAGVTVVKEQVSGGF